jgi:hypothetical protein
MAAIAARCRSSTSVMPPAYREPSPSAIELIANNRFSRWRHWF